MAERLLDVDDLEWWLFRSQSVINNDEVLVSFLPKLLLFYYKFYIKYYFNFILK